MINVRPLCILLLAITATIAKEQKRPSNVTAVSPQTSQLARREAIVLDNIPVESNLNKRQSKIIYRRISRPNRYKHAMSAYGKPKYGPPRPKYGPPKSKRRPPKKHRGKPMKPKYGLPKSRPKKHYPAPLTKNRRPVYYGAPMSHGPYVPQEPAGFGEPPSDRFVVNNAKPSYGEPPTDSYGAPIGLTMNEGTHSFKPNNYESNSYSSYAPESYHSFPPHQSSYSSNQLNSYSQNFSPNAHSTFSLEPNYAASSYSQHNVGSNYAVSNGDVIGGHDEPSIESTDDKHHPASHNDDDNTPQRGKLNPQPPVRFLQDEHTPQPVKFNHQPQNIFPSHQSSYKPVRSKYKLDPLKTINRPRKGPRGKNHPEEIIVGGQYAEPPARYVAKFQPSAQMYTGDSSFEPSVKMELDSDESGSNHHSSYVNYKNSNMAFSPQNLNDAFSVPY